MQMLRSSSQETLRSLNVYAIHDLLADLGLQKSTPSHVNAHDSAIPWGYPPQNERKPVWDAAKPPSKISRRSVKRQLRNL